MIEAVINWILVLDIKVIFVICMTFLLLVISIFFHVLIIFSKISRSKTQILKKKYWGYIKENLALIAVQSVVREGSELEYSRSLRVLQWLRFKSDKMAQWILEEIIRQKANVSGDASKTMLKVYKDLDLKFHSLKKLKSFRWYKRAEGIHELERMEQRECFSEFYRFLNSRNQDLRRAARMGLTTLAPYPLSFLDHIKEELSEWEQMSIYHRLRKRPKNQLPDFSKYYHHEQPSVVTFCINMTVRFNYFELVPQLIELLKTTSRRIPVIAALTKLEGFQALPLIRKLIHITKNKTEIIACLKFMAHIDDHSCQPWILKLLNHEDTEVRMEAAKVAVQLDLQLESDSFTKELKNMFSHHKNELIS